MAEDIKTVQGEAPKNVPARGAILAGPERAFVGFVDFIRERGVMGLAIGFVLGSSVQKVVTAFVNDIINPFVGMFLGGAEGLRSYALGPFLVGDFLAVMIDFLILAAIVYFVFKGLKLDRLDKPKE